MKFAILCSGKIFQKWQADAIRTLIRHGHQPVVLITNNNTSQNQGRLTAWRNKKLSTILFSVMENRLFFPALRQCVSLEDDLKNTDTLQCHVQVKKYSSVFLPGDIQLIGNYKPDFILRFAFGILKGDILKVARYGVWSFHHDDEMKYRGGPAGFWEIYTHDHVNGAILQRLTEKLDGGIILKKAILKTINHSWKGNVNQLYDVTSSWPALVADEIENHGYHDHHYPSSKSDARIYRIPRNFQMVKFILILLINKVKFLWQNNLFVEKWNVGIIEKSPAGFALEENVSGHPKIYWLPETRKGEYLADPFGTVINNRKIVFAEWYDYRKMKGKIARIHLPDKLENICDFSLYNNLQEVKIENITSNKTHQSYPQFLSPDLVMTESWESGKIILYTLNQELDGMSEHITLLRDVEAVDPTLFFHDNRWWLFFTLRKYSNTHLYLFYNENLTEGFVGHPKNPVKMDIRSSRPAGNLFVYEGQLYRPAQDCSETYGGRIAINRITTLTTEHYAEETIRLIEPGNSGRYKKGLHTISSIDHFTLVDGKDYRFDLSFGFSQFMRKIRHENKKPCSE